MWAWKRKNDKDITLITVKSHSHSYRHDQHNIVFGVLLYLVVQTFFLCHTFFDDKSKLGARLYKIRSNGIITVSGGQNAKKGPTDLAKNSGYT